MTTASDQTYEKIQALIKEKPELGSVVASKLTALYDELEEKDVSKITSGFGDIHLGFDKFKKGSFEKNPKLFNKLKTGQWPTYMVIACADSRVCPTSTLGLQPGDAFMVRNIANMIPTWEKEGNPSMGAALEYAVLHLKVKHILVMGHRACGGVGALVKMTPDDGQYKTDFIEKWVEIGKPARKQVNAKLEGESVEAICKSCETESVNNSLANLKTYPFVVEAVSKGDISLHGGYYDFMEGTFNTWDFSLKN